jgi:UDP-N-acetyl-D-glucosamine dehydrogenase
VGADVTVCGLGYVGLALAREASAAGLVVTGYDINESIVDGLRAGHSHVDDVFDEDLAAMAATGFTATGDADALGRAPVVVVCVPTPLDRHGQPSLGPVFGAVTGIANRLRRGMLVILESTSYPGTTEEVVLPILERCSGLTAGVDFNLAFSPERIDPGNRMHSVAKTPKVVGGFTPACTERAARFYAGFVDQVVVARGTREAEMAKLLENTYRHVNIGLVNEMAMLCHELGIDIWDVIDCASTKPFGFQPFQPGPGVGGHCIPVDPLYLAYKANQVGFVSTLIEAAQRVNTGMPGYVVRRCEELLRSHGRELSGADVVLLGVTYKANIADSRMSPAYDVVRELRARGASVSYHDPYADDWAVDRRPVRRQTNLDAAMRTADLTVVLQKHGAYDAARLPGTARLLFDARGLLVDRARDGATAVDVL